LEADSRAWDRDLRALQSPAPLLQSWAWGEVQARAGWRVERVRLEGALATVLLRGRGPLRWGYAPRGPLPATPAAVDALAAWAREAGLARLRVEPEGPKVLADDLRRLGFQPSDPVQPASTAIVELKPDEELLKAFEQRTRYAIRVAERRGVTVAAGADGAELDRLSQGSAARQHIRLPGRDYYENLLERLPGSRTYVAGQGGRALAAALTASFDGRAYYLFAGWDGEHPELNPTYAALWAAMRAARDGACRDFDLWGVPPTDDPAHPWHGLGLFKRGFGGRRVDYAGTWDLVISRLGHGLGGAEERARRGVRRLRPR